MYQAGVTCISPLARLFLSCNATKKRKTDMDYRETGELEVMSQFSLYFVYFFYYPGVWQRAVCTLS